VVLQPFTPRPAQEEAISAILADHAHLCRGETGAGKTIVGVEASLRSKAQRVAIVAPLNTFTGWRKTFERQSHGTCSIRWIDSTKAGKAAFEDLALGTPGVYFLGWERFRMYDWREFAIDFIIYDEVHRGTNRKSVTHTAMKSVRAEYVLGLSATPFGDRIEGAWAVLRALFGEAVSGKSYWTWVTKFLKTVRDPYSPGPKPAGEKNPGAVWDSIPSKSYFPSPFQAQPIVHEVYVPLQPAQRKVYEKLEREAVVWLGENLLATSIPAVQYLRLREVCLAIPSIRHLEDGTEEVYFEEDAKSTKIDAALEVLSDLYADKPVPVVVYTHSRKFATMMTKRLQKAGYRARRFVGGMNPTERAWKLEEFGKEFDILVVTISAVSEGTDGMQLVSNIEFWMSVEERRILNHQAKGRLSRDGQTKTVQRYLFFAADTVETNRQLPRQETDQAMLDASFEPSERKAA
jgi:superfamily II DNA or RNA helicase